MARVDGGDLAIKALKREGVAQLFALSGDHIQSLFDACIDEGMKIIDTRHEQAAVHMADGWARVTGQPGVALVTGGPGVVDAIPAVAVAYQSASPTIILAGRTPLSVAERGHGQDLDHLSLVRPLTKWATTCYDTRRIPEYISLAFRYATSGRPGPVYLDIPDDVLEATADEGSVSYPAPYRPPSPPGGDPKAVAAVVDLLLGAARPLILAGSGVWWAQAEAELREFVELAQIPVTLSQMARGALPEDHALCYGPMRVGTRTADVILVLGARLNTWLNYGQPPLFGTDQRWIQVDIDGSEIGKNRPIDIPIVGDARVVLQQMIELAQPRAQGRGSSPWLEECQDYARDRRQRIEAELNSSQVPIHPLRLCHDLARFLRRDATIVIDGGEIAVSAIQGLRVYQPGHWLDNGNLGHLGPGIPFGIAAQLARPGGQVLVLSGDGSFGLNGMEMDTAVRHRLPIVTVVANDGAWGTIKHRQQVLFGPERVIGVDLGPIRYDRMVAALGGYGEWVEKAEDIIPALQRAFSSGVPACVNVQIDPNVISPLIRRSVERRGPRE